MLHACTRKHTSLQELISQLEWCIFEAQIAWGVGENKSKVNVQYVSIAIQQNVAVVPVEVKMGKCVLGS